jgi:hypothetical protein
MNRQDNEKQTLQVLSNNRFTTLHRGGTSRKRKE